MSSPFTALVSSPANLDSTSSKRAYKDSDAESLLFSNTRKPQAEVQVAAARSAYVQPRPPVNDESAVWGLGRFNAQRGGQTPVGEGVLLQTAVLPSRSTEEFQGQRKNLLEFGHEDKNNLVRAYDNYDGFVDNEWIQKGAYFLSALGDKLGQNWFHYPYETSFGNFTTFSILGRFSPISVRYFAEPISIVFSGSMTEQVLDPAHQDNPLKAFARMRESLENRQSDYAVSSEEIAAQAGYYDHFPVVKAPETANFVRAEFNVLSQLAYNVGVRLGEGHWLGFREMPDPTQGSLLRNPVSILSPSTLREAEVRPTYTRPLFNDSYTRFHFRIGEPVGVALASGATFNYQGWPEYYKIQEYDGQGLPVERWKIDLFDFSNTSQ